LNTSRFFCGSCYELDVEVLLKSASSPRSSHTICTISLRPLHNHSATSAQPLRDLSTNSAYIHHDLTTRSQRPLSVLLASSQRPLSFLSATSSRRFRDIPRGLHALSTELRFRRTLFYLSLLSLPTSLRRATISLRPLHYPSMLCPRALDAHSVTLPRPLLSQSN